VHPVGRGGRWRAAGDRGGCCRMNATTWRTDDPCPVCGTGLHYTDDGISAITQDCRLCGWSATWQADMNQEAK
jgi:hypothetical protein